MICCVSSGYYDTIYILVFSPLPFFSYTCDMPKIANVTGILYFLYPLSAINSIIQYTYNNNFNLYNRYVIYIIMWVCVMCIGDTITSIWRLFLSKYYL